MNLLKAVTALFSGGPGGTPSSLTLTNATGLPIGGITMNTARLLGRTTASAGAAQEITVGTGLSLAAGSLTASASALSSKLVTATRDNTIADGTQAITGAGFQPTACIILASVSDTSAMGIGMADSASAEMSLEDRYVVVANGYNVLTTTLLRLNVSAANNNAAVHTSWDADGMTITWTKTGSPTGTTTLAILFLK